MAQPHYANLLFIYGAGVCLLSRNSKLLSYIEADKIDAAKAAKSKGKNKPNAWPRKKCIFAPKSEKWRWRGLEKWLHHAEAAKEIKLNAESYARPAMKCRCWAVEPKGRAAGGAGEKAVAAGPAGGDVVLRPRGSWKHGEGMKKHACIKLGIARRPAPWPPSATPAAAQYEAEINGNIVRFALMLA